MTPANQHHRGELDAFTLGTRAIHDAALSGKFAKPDDVSDFICGVLRSASLTAAYNDPRVVANEDMMFAVQAEFLAGYAIKTQALAADIGNATRVDLGLRAQLRAAQNRAN